MGSRSLSGFPRPRLGAPDRLVPDDGVDPGAGRRPAADSCSASSASESLPATRRARGRKLPRPAFYEGYTSVGGQTHFDVNDDGFPDPLLVQRPSSGMFTRSV